ncbi:MAG: hypothetical protein JO218_14560 [Burkholderiales bacterium]|nr:hypothetical protein [Burkholderiales bacterium]
MSIASINALNTGFGVAQTEPSTSRILAALAVRAALTADANRALGGATASSTPVPANLPAVDQAAPNQATTIFFTPTGQLQRELATGAPVAQAAAMPANDTHFGNAPGISLNDFLAAAPNLALIEASNAFANPTTSRSDLGTIFSSLAADTVAQSAAQNLQAEADITFLNNLEANQATQLDFNASNTSVSSLALQGLQATGLVASLQRATIAKQVNQANAAPTPPQATTTANTANGTTPVPPTVPAVPAVTSAANTAAAATVTATPVTTETAPTEAQLEETQAQLVALVSTDPAEIDTVAAYHMTPTMARLLQADEPPAPEPSSPIEIPDVGLIARVDPVDPLPIERRPRPGRYRGPS